MTGFRRDGHVTDLALERLLAGSAGDELRAHVHECGACAGRLAAAQAVEVPPLAAVATPARRRSGWWAAAPVGLALAAAAVFALRAPEVDDGLRMRGSAVSLAVFRDEGPTSRRLRDGDRAAAGDHLGFRVRARASGHVMIVSWDGQTPPWACYPQSADGRSAPVDGGPRYVDIPAAVRLDDAPGRERFAAVWCPRPFGLEEGARYLRDGQLPEGCAGDAIQLVKP